MGQHAGWRYFMMAVAGALVFTAIIVLAAFASGTPIPGALIFGGPKVPLYAVRVVQLNVSDGATGTGNLTVSKLGNLCTLLLQGIFTLNGQNGSALVFAGPIPADCRPVPIRPPLGTYFPVTITEPGFFFPVSVAGYLLIFSDGTFLVGPTIGAMPLDDGELNYNLLFYYPPFTAGENVSVDVGHVTYLNSATAGPSPTLVDTASTTGFPRTSADWPAYARRVVDGHPRRRR